MSSTYQRQRYVLKTDTGVPANVTKGDTGPSFHGEIMQVLYSHGDTGVADTGANITVNLVPQDGMDTGFGVNVLATLDLGAARRMFVPRQDIQTPVGGPDTGNAPFVSAGDRLRVKITAGRTLDATLEQIVWVYIKT